MTMTGAPGDTGSPDHHGSPDCGDSDEPGGPLLPPLAELVADFEAVGPSDRVQLLLELSEELPELPADLAAHRDQLERVPECQTPLFLGVQVDDQDRVHLYFDAPRESPTTRGFAAILYSGLDNAPSGAVLETPDDFYLRLGLADAVSPLRLRGMAALLARIKRNVREQRATESVAGE